MEVRGYEARNFLKEKLEILGNEIAQELSKYNKRSLVNYHFGNLEYGLIDICFSEGKTPKEILETIFSSKETLATLKGYAQKKSEHLPEVVDDNLKISYDILLTLILRHAKDKGGKEFDARNSTLYSNVQKYLYWISKLYSFDPLNQEKFVVKVEDG
ncbi:MAG: hypothetical protein QMD14_04480, partial [Candidatus Aenigmarchaeota archaeon]|nr:hypothetical protein [Candidatus Aenigmarchaeota archaeon]